MERKIQWYLNPRDTHTKDCIIQGLMDKGEMADPSNPMGEVLVKGGKRLIMIPVPEYFFVNFTKRSAANSGYDFVPYVREGDGPAKVWKLDQRKKTARNKKVREMKKQLVELKGKLAKKND